MDAPLAEITRRFQANQATVLFAMQNGTIAVEQSSKCVTISESAIAAQLNFDPKKLIYCRM
jgi:hypothetical protein